MLLSLAQASEYARPELLVSPEWLEAHVGDPDLRTYCQAGGRAAHEIFVLHLMGYDDLRLYLGSWEDWSRREDLPVARPPQ